MNGKWFIFMFWFRKPFIFLFSYMFPLSLNLRLLCSSTPPPYLLSVRWHGLHPTQEAASDAVLYVLPSSVHVGGAFDVGKRLLTAVSELNRWKILLFMIVIFLSNLFISSSVIKPNVLTWPEWRSFAVVVVATELVMLN